MNLLIRDLTDLLLNYRIGT